MTESTQDQHEAMLDRRRGELDDIQRAALAVIEGRHHITDFNPVHWGEIVQAGQTLQEFGDFPAEARAAAQGA